MASPKVLPLGILETSFRLLSLTCTFDPFPLFLIPLCLNVHPFTHSQHLAAVERSLGLVVDDAVAPHVAVYVFLPVDDDAQFLPQENQVDRFLIPFAKSIVLLTGAVFIEF